MTKRKCLSTVLIAVLTALIAVSCAPAPAPEDIERIPVRGDAKDISVRAVYDTYFSVGFRHITNASSYEIEVTSGKETIKQPVSLQDDWKDGSFVVSVYGLKAETEYGIRLKVYDRDGKETVLEYPGKVKTKKAMSVTDKTKPVAWLDGISEVSGGTFTARIKIDQRSAEKYRITVIPVPESAEPSDKPWTVGDIKTEAGVQTYTIPGITEKALIMVEHGTVENDVPHWSQMKTMISFPSSIDMYDAAFKLEYKDGLFNWTGAKKESVALYSYTDGKTRFETVLTGNDSKGWKNHHSLESALYFLTDGEKVSNPVFLTTGPVVKVEKDQQNITLRWKEPAGFPITYSGIKQPVTENGEKVLRMTGLESLTEYTFPIKANFLDGRTAETTVTVTTDSFEGRYRWNDREGAEKSAENFIVNVKKAPEGSDFKYWVYTDLEDAKCRKDEATVNYRLSPLVDPKKDAFVPEGFTPFSDTSFPSARAYHWNESKWNSSDMHPNEWQVDSVKIEGDKVTSLVKTKAVIFQLTTETVMDFRLDPDGKPILSFGNKGIGSKAFFVNGNLNINHNIRPELGEDEYTYVLEWIGDANEIKEDI